MYGIRQPRFPAAMARLIVLVCALLLVGAAYGAPIDIVLSLNQAYLPGCHGLLRTLETSIATHNTSVYVHIIIPDGTTIEAQVRSWNLSFPIAFVVFSAPAHIKTAAFGPAIAHYVNDSIAYARLYMAELLPHVDRCLFLDCDTKVSRDLPWAALGDMLQHHPIAAVPMQHYRFYKAYRMKRHPLLYLNYDPMVSTTHPMRAHAPHPAPRRTPPL